jgi:hypothetical protein
VPNVTRVSSELSSIDWEALRHAYGSAGDVPDLLQELSGNSEQAREAAIDQLWSSLCHQETVYSASAATVPFLFDAARSPRLSDTQRYLLLSLVVYIGRGGDTTWKGYSTWEEAESCREAVAAVAPEVIRWAAAEEVPARVAAVALCVYFPTALEQAGVGLSALTDGLTEPRLAAACDLTARIVAGQPLDDAVVHAAAEMDSETLDYVEQALEGEPVDRKARGAVLELLERGVGEALR